MKTGAGSADAVPRLSNSRSLPTDGEAKTAPGGSPGFRLPKQARLLKRAQFLALTDRRLRPDLIVKTASFLALGRLNGLPWSRLGLTATKKIGSAVVRNRLKRRAREFFRRHRNAWPAAMDLLLIARQEAAARRAADLDADLAKIGERLAAFAPPQADGPEGSAPAVEGGLAPVRRRPEPNRPLAAAAALSAAALEPAALAAIGFYRRFISPFLPPACRFRPTCSQYAAQVITRHGFWRGVLLAARRLLKCHPWHPGGYDPAPPAG